MIDFKKASRILLVILFFGAFAHLALAKEPLQLDLKKLKTWADKNGFKSISSEYSADKYSGTKNELKMETELSYILRYNYSLPLQLVCLSCKTKDILPTDLATCRAEFVKMYLAVSGARPKFTTVPALPTPAQLEQKAFGDDNRFAVTIQPKKCTQKDRTGYEYTIIDSKSLM